MTYLVSHTCMPAPHYLTYPLPLPPSPSLLVPYAWYMFSVLAKTDAAGRDLYSVPRLFRTLQALPSSVQLTLVALNHTSLLASWAIPNCSNGVLMGYVVRMQCDIEMCIKEYLPFTLGDVFHHSTHLCNSASHFTKPRY